MPPSATSPNGTPRARSGPFGLGCSAMAFGIVVHRRRYASAPRRRAGHERTTNSFDLFQFRVRKYLARRPSIVSGLRLKAEGRGLHRALRRLTLCCERTLEVHSPHPAAARHRRGGGRPFLAGPAPSPSRPPNVRGPPPPPPPGAAPPR